MKALLHHLEPPIHTLPQRQQQKQQQQQLQVTMTTGTIGELLANLQLLPQRRLLAGRHQLLLRPLPPQMTGIRLLPQLRIILARDLQIQPTTILVQLVLILLLLLLLLLLDTRARDLGANSRCNQRSNNQRKQELAFFRPIQLHNCRVPWIHRLP